MEELKKLLGMDLPEEAKALLTKVESNVLQLDEANKNFMESIEKKDKANSDAFDDRKKLREEIAKLKEESLNGGTKDNGEQIEAINKQWQEKYGGLEQEYKGLQNKVSEADRLAAFNSLNMASQFPKEWDESQTAFAMKAIQREVFEGSVYDHENGTWGYGEVGKLHFNTKEGKPYSIESKAKELIENGAFDMFFAGKQGNGGGSLPNAGNPSNNSGELPKMNPTEMMKQGRK